MGASFIDMPDITEEQHLRHVQFPNGCTLRTWDAYSRCNTGQRKIGYEFKSSAGEVIFRGEDIGVASSDAIDSDAATWGAVGWFTLKPGDTDSEFFDDYTPAQLEWCESSEAEELSLFVYDHESGDTENIRWSRGAIANLDDRDEWDEFNGARCIKCGLLLSECESC